ncbi:MAG: phosphodiester glycosidase family protein [Chloroflexi bacterium]|nr:phosphodiester glycosidase family protein [Chloroflexota bacterium]
MPKKRRKFTLLLVALSLLAGLCLAPVLYYGGRPLPLEKHETLYPGVEYYRSVRLSPRLVIIHIVTVDLTQPGLDFLVTPGDPAAELPLSAMTTARFLERYDLQLAINGDGFTPWVSNGILDYYPHSGDPVAPNGYAVSQGVLYNDALTGHPTLNIFSDGRLSIGDPDANVRHAITGDLYLVRSGEAVAGLDAVEPMPRTALGLDAGGTRLALVVVDGRQPFYSLGMTFAELADLMVANGAATAMSLDGGGSSTLVVSGLGGGARVLNSPIDNNIPGRQRPVGNHLGIYIQR